MSGFYQEDPYNVAVRNAKNRITHNNAVMIGRRKEKAGRLLNVLRGFWHFALKAKDRLTEMPLKKIKLNRKD